MLPFHMNRNIKSSFKSSSPSTSPLPVTWGAGNDTCIFAILPVTAYLKNGCTAIHTYAFLDNGSNVSFCSDSLMNQLGASGKKMRLN